MKLFLSEIAYLNNTSFDILQHNEIEYLDTSSVFEGVFQPPRKYKVEEGVPIPSRAKRGVKNDTIVYSSVRPRQHHFGIITNPSNNLVVSSGFVTIDANREVVDPHYLYYVITQPKYIEAMCSIADVATSSYPSFRPDDLGNLEIDIETDIEKQRIIASYLSLIDRKKEVNNVIISTLESMAKDIYDYWFVQFDFPDENGKPYKSSGGKMVWNEELKREIPEGWMKGCVSSIATLINDQVSPEDNEIYIHYSIPAFDSGRIPVKEQGSTIESNKYVVSKEMILASKLNPQFPRIWWPAFIEDNMICSTEFLPLIPNNELYRVFLYLLLKSDALCTEMKQKATCSTGSRRRIDPDVFMSMCFALPTNKTIIAFSEKVFPIIEKVNFCLKENEDLTSLRDFLLPLLMNGQVKIGEVEL